VSLIDALNELKMCCDAELILRTQAGIEFNNGNQNGTMKAAHDQAIQNVIKAAGQIISLAK